MDVFEKLTLFDRSRYDQLFWLNRLGLRFKLRALQNQAIVQLETRKLTFMKAFPTFDEVEPNIQDILIYPFVRTYADALEQSLISNVEYENIEEKRIVLLQQLQEKITSTV